VPVRRHQASHYRENAFALARLDAAWHSW
jgi:hypothetical protein